MINQFRQWLSGPSPGTRLELFQHHTRAFWRIQTLIRAFYAFLALIAIMLVPQWGFIIWHDHAQPLWPVFWLNEVNARQGIQIILLLYTTGALAAAAFPHLTWTRILAFIGILEYWSFNNSFGKVGHSLHLAVLISFVFIFLPNGWHQVKQKHRIIRQTTLVVFWSVQCAVMMSYSMAGLIKVMAGFWQLSQGQPNIFMPDALARHVADRLLETNSTSWWGSWLIEHAWLSWPLMLGTLYLELFAIVTIFRPRLQLAFALGLVIFHISSFFSMTIIFPENCYLLFLFFASMPLLQGSWTWRDFAGDLPIIGSVLTKMLGRTVSA